MTDKVNSISEKDINELKGLIDQTQKPLIITHYKRILTHIKPDIVFVMKDGKIIKTGDASIVDELEENGYGELK